MQKQLEIDNTESWMSDIHTICQQTYLEPLSNLIFVVSNEVTGLSTTSDQCPSSVGENGGDLS